ncbi:hypothetical protein QE152_g30561 [Popillia japonica]|uniref:Uncharacterized protein n=1 Tax=Popillia japonica TaxID=7064 RepID=A0AAW1JE87_POPJA
MSHNSLRENKERKCRTGCDKIESLAHVLQACPTTHYERIKRHNSIVAKVARHCRRKGWTTEVDPSWPKWRATAEGRVGPLRWSRVSDTSTASYLSQTWQSTSPIARLQSATCRSAGKVPVL